LAHGGDLFLDQAAEPPDLAIRALATILNHGQIRFAATWATQPADSLSTKAPASSTTPAESGCCARTPTRYFIVVGSQPVLVHNCATEADAVLARNRAEELQDAPERLSRCEEHRNNGSDRRLQQVHNSVRTTS
jgi:hypothetical protein